jgi:hypothetical protein
MGRAVKPRHLLSAAAMLVALLAGWLAEPKHSFEQRFVSMPPAMSWETFQVAREAAKRPAFCRYAWFEKCRIS